MSGKHIRAVAALALLIAVGLAVAGCGGGGGGSAASGTKAKVVIGTKFDQPGLALQGAGGVMSGFDVDVASYVARELGYRPDQIEWKKADSAQRENLIDNDQVDYIVGTYSINDERRKRIDFAGPYLTTGQGLLVRASDTDITDRSSLAGGKKLCSVKGSTPAQRIKNDFPTVQLQEYPNYSACVEALRRGAIDALTTDEVILAGFAAQTPGAFKLVGGTFSTENYGIGLKKGDIELRARIDDAITKMQRDGDLARAFEKNLGAAGIAPPTTTGGPDVPASRGLTGASGEVFDLTAFLKAFWTTIQLTVFSAVGALLIGTVLAAMRLSPVPVLDWLGTAYVNVVRNTPLTLILLLSSLGLYTSMGVALAASDSPNFIAENNFRLAVLGLSLYTASFVCETLRSGVNTIPLGQAEAARSLGLSFGQNLRIVLLPQAFRATIIPMGSVLIALTKNTTIASVIGVAEASLLMAAWVEKSSALLLVGSLFAAGFVVLTLPLGLAFGWLGRRLAVAR